MSQLTQIQFLHISIPISSSRHGHPNPLKSGRRRPPQRERKPQMERRKTRSQRERRQRKERKIRKGRTRKERMERMEKIMLMKMMSRTQRNFDAMLSNRPRRQVSLMQLTPLIFLDQLVSSFSPGHSGFEQEDPNCQFQEAVDFRLATSFRFIRRF